MPEVDQNQSPGGEPDCLSMDDAIAAVRKCLKKIIGDTADDLKMSTNIADALPDDDDLASLRRLLTCIKNNTSFDLDAGDFSDGTFQDIADKLACAGDNS